jgi:hypothetical protein
MTNTLEMDVRMLTQQQEGESFNHKIRNNFLEMKMNITDGASLYVFGRISVDG